jgi:hypothetical protein
MKIKPEKGLNESLRLVLIFAVIVLSGLMPIWLSGCSGSSGNSSPQNQGKIYFSGTSILETTEKRAVVWKDGIPSALPVKTGTTGGQAEGMYINVNDVYVCGEMLLAGSEDPMPVYWKNGEPVSLHVESGYGYALSILATDAAVYVAGMDGDNDPVVWVNGERTGLPLVEGYEGGAAVKIIKDGNDIYVGGKNWIHEGEEKPPLPVYWKNGTVHPLLDPSMVSSGPVGIVWGLAVKEGVLYAAGEYRTRKYDISQPAYWKGSELVTLDNDNLEGAVNAIDVQGGYVICGGWSREISEFSTSTIVKPALWINGRKRILSHLNPLCQGMVNDVKYLNGAVYAVGGTKGVPGSDRVTACYWKNGVRTDLEGLIPYAPLNNEGTICPTLPDMVIGISVKDQ